MDYAVTLDPETPDWTHLRSMLGGSGYVPDAITRMLKAASAEDANAAYWELDNRVVVQGQLFEAASWTARVVAQEVCNGNPSTFGLPLALDLLVEIAVGEADQSEVALGNDDLADQCQRELRRFLPCFRDLARKHQGETLAGLLDLLETLEE